MRRSRTTVVALLCALAQVAISAAAALGLVVCVGEDHAGIELPSSGCCATHGAAARTDGGSAFEEACCSDVPLCWAAPQLSDVPRSQPLATGVVLALLPRRTPPPPGGLDGRPVPSSPTSAPARRILRSVILRL